MAPQRRRRRLCRRSWDSEAGVSHTGMSVLKSVDRIEMEDAPEGDEKRDRLCESSGSD